jgi:hypothetical protein
VVHARNWGEDRVYFYDDDGQLKSVPSLWTSLGEVDPFVVFSGGRSAFRPRDLLALAELLEVLKKGAGRGSEAGGGDGGV